MMLLIFQKNLFFFMILLTNPNQIAFNHSYHSENYFYLNLYLIKIARILKFIKIIILILSIMALN